MGEGAGSRIILIGFSTTGKSKVGDGVARYLGWQKVETDDEIVRLTGTSIDEIFARQGEEYFRQVERQVLVKACDTDRAVISAGGGAVLDPQNRELMKKSGAVVCLEASPETIYRRLLEDRERGVVRPLLEVADPLRQIKELKDSRQPFYSIADWTVHTDNLSVDEACREVIRGWDYWSRARQRGAGQSVEGDLACEVVTPTERYPVFVGRGLLDNLGQRLTQAGLSDTAYILSDESVFGLHGNRVVQSLRSAGMAVNTFVVPPGEDTKTIDTATQIYDWLTQHRAERTDVVVALGGGMVGDLAGFVAATFLRGMPLVQVPTSLVAMVDASLGGKAAVNHPKAKNLIGAFYQPRLVVADIQTLATLPRREMASGWAEVIKHALILDSSLFDFLEANNHELQELDSACLIEAVRRSAAVKARIVSLDETERGIRTLLNYGHTIAHGLEAASDYRRFLHGEAVAIGMMGAAMIAHGLGLLVSDVVERQRALLQAFGLPVNCSGIEPSRVLEAMELDKKTRGGAIRWVLITDIGQAVIRDDVPHESVVRAVDTLLS